jgi:hypothetical protein
MQASTPSGSPGWMPLLLKKTGRPSRLICARSNTPSSADHAGVHRHAGVGRAGDLAETEDVRIAPRQVLVPGDAFGPGGGLVAVALFVRREQFVGMVSFVEENRYDTAAAR